MKSVFMLCDYGLAYSTVLKLFENNITIHDIIDNPECVDKTFGKNNKKTNEIKLIAIEVLKSENNYSLYDLMPYGLSKTIISLLLNNNISFNDINETLKQKEFISNSTYSKIMNSYNEFIIHRNLKRDLDEDKLILIIKNFYRHNFFSIEDLSQLLEKKMYDTQNILFFLQNLLNKRHIRRNEKGYYLSRPSLKKELDKISNKNNHYDIVMKKLLGNTLESIGTDYNVTRERIRQIVKKELNRLPEVYEDEKYKEIFTTYHFDCDLFCELYSENKIVYYYLKEKYDIGDLEPSKLIENNNVSKLQLEILKKKYNLINFYGENIVVNRTNILISILKNVNVSVEYSELISQYNKIIDDYNLELEPLTEDDFRNIDRILSQSTNVLCDSGRYYRYYNTDELDTEDIFGLEQILNVDSGGYSTEFFYKNNTVLMKQLDIRNGYELHNLLRKKIGNFNGKIIYSRMPDILIDCEDKREFILNQIQEMSPIGLEEFVDYMYKNYGHRINSFTALMQSEFNKFITNGIVMIDSPEFTIEQTEMLNKRLQDDIYSILTIKEMLTELFDVDDFKLLNNLNFSKLGYKLRGNYIMKSEITNLEAYLRKIILSSDYYEIKPEMKKIGSTFTNYLYKFIYNLDLFKIADEKYITIKKMNEMGISKDDIKLYIEEINDSIIDEKFFNLYTLNEKYKSKFINYNFPDCFYESLISTIPDIKTFKIKNNYLFIRTEEQATREQFINSFIKKNKTYINEIKNAIYNNYNIDLEEYYIREFINRKKYYFDTSTDCVFLNKDLYEEEVNEFDILQFID